MSWDSKEPLEAPWATQPPRGSFENPHWAARTPSHLLSPPTTTKWVREFWGVFLESMYSQNGDWVHACVLNTETSVFSSLDPYPHEGDSGPSLVHLTCLGAPPVSSRAMRAEFTSVLQRLPLRCEGNLPTCVKNRDRVLQKRLRESKSREENQKYCHW